MPDRRVASDAVVLRRAVSGLQRRLRAQDGPGGIPPTSLGILGRLIRTGVTSATEIAELEGLQPQSLTRSLKSLADDGLIDRWTDEDDRRRTSIAITPKGEALLRDTMRKRVLWLARALETRLTPAERETMRAAALLMERLAGAGRESSRVPDALVNLIPFARVADIERSLEFYARLGFVEDGRFEHDGKVVWASMHLRMVRAARIMFSLDSESLEPQAPGTVFYCWSNDVAALRARLVGDGLAPGPISYPPHMEDGEFELDDPDGNHLIVGQPRRSG